MGKSKKELDRDMMFRKIMPALADNPFSAPVVDPDPELEELTASPDPAEASAQLEYLAEERAEAPPSPLQGMAGSLLIPPAPSDSLPEPRPAPNRVEVPAPPKDDPPDDDLSVLRAKLFARSGVGGTGMEPICTINLMESLVLKHLDEVIQRFNCCRCDRCRRDIAAYALSHLPAQYIVAEAGNMNKMEQKIPKKTVYDALVKAVIQVRASPRH